MNDESITSLDVKDIRFPTSLQKDGSDAMHQSPDYSAVYVTLGSENTIGCGLTFTLGRGNEIVKMAVKSLEFLVVGQSLSTIQTDMNKWINSMTNHGQLRWLGPEKGVLALAVAAIVNAFWDLWGKIENKPVWKLLVDMEPEKIISLINFKYITDIITKEEALNILIKSQKVKMERQRVIEEKGFPAYTTQVGWLGYSDEKITKLSEVFLKRGFTAFKMKVGKDIEDDKRRLKILRDSIGWNHKIMVDANQVWDVDEAIEWMTALKEFQLTWIEEPTSPDDILGHKKISEALSPYNIGVASGEVCQNRVMFKQFLSTGALQYCQIDCGRMAGLNEVLCVYLMAHKLQIPVCPHAGGVGLCEMVQHCQVFDYVLLSGTFENRMIEYIDHLHEHFIHPPNMSISRYFPPKDFGYSTEMKKKSLEDYEYPNGQVWKELSTIGKY